MIVRNIQDLHRAMENNLEKKITQEGNDYDPILFVYQRAILLKDQISTNPHLSSKESDGILLTEKQLLSVH